MREAEAMVGLVLLGCFDLRHRPRFRLAPLPKRPALGVASAGRSRRAAIRAAETRSAMTDMSRDGEAHRFPTPFLIQLSIFRWRRVL